MKDAASAAIYGSRGASGVVLITTKRGNSGKARIDYDYQFSVQQVECKIKLLDAYQFRDLVIDARNNSYRDKAEAAGKSWNPLDDNAIRASKGFNLNEVGISDLFFDFTTGKPVEPAYNTDWQDAIYGNAPMHRHNLSVTGGQDFLKYRFSLGYLDQDGIIAPSNHKRLNVRANVDAEVTKRLKVGVNFSFVDVSERQVQADGRYINDGIVQSALLMFPQFPVYNTDGSYAVGNQIAMKADGYQMVENPVALAHEIDIRNKSSRMNFNANITYDILKQLQFKANLGTQYYTSRYNYYRPRTVGQDGDMPNSDAIQARVKARDITNRDVDRLGEFTLNYNGEYGKHRLNALVGYTLQKKTYDRVAIEATGFPDDRIHEVTAHGPNASDVGLYSSDTRKAAWTMMSYLARVNYSFDNRYVVTGTVRTDGSSRFGKNNRWGTFPSVSLAWRISQEEWFPKDNSPVNDLKLRIGYGVTGNQEIGNYGFVASYNTGVYPFGNNNSTALVSTTLSNPNIHWEEVRQTNFGVDMSLFNSRVNLSLDAYIKKTADMLVKASIPITSGFEDTTETFTNAGKMRNKGVEMTLRTINLKGLFSWESALTATYNKNEILDLNSETPMFINQMGNSYVTMLRAGYPINVFYGYMTDGLFQNWEEVNRHATQPGAAPGDIRFRDLNNDGVINDEDRTVIGNPNPNWFFSLSNNFSYKGWELSVFLQGVSGNKIYNANNVDNEGMAAAYNQTTAVLNRWTGEGTSNSMPRAIWGDPNQNCRVSDRFVENGSYLRLKNITLSYTLPKKWMQKIQLENARISFSCENVATITGYSGFDPEVDINGIDSSRYPISRTFSMGLNFNF